MLGSPGLAPVGGLRLELAGICMLDPLIPDIPDIPAMLPVAGGVLFGAALDSAGICIVEGSIPAMLLDVVSAGATRAGDEVTDVRPVGVWAADSLFPTAVLAPSEQAEATMLPQIQYSAL